MMATHQVLVVEDDETIRDSLVDFLEENGYDAVGAVNGRDALDRLVAAGTRPCVIVLDLMMPVMDGQAFREAQVGVPELVDIPVVVISAYKDLPERAKKLKVAGHLEKPLKLADLLTLVRQHCPAI
jgi:CheY-like chemotaxis protein